MIGRVRLSLAVAAGKLAANASRRFGRGGGTALPGLVAERVSPKLVADVATQLGKGACLVSGTNGKTTTTLMLSAMVGASGLRPLHNRSGSNLMRGLTATFVAETSLLGRLPDGERRLGVFEVDEAALPSVARAVRPRAIALLNLFRDQLDRYGEVDIIADRWRDMVGELPRDTILVINADDPSIAAIGDGRENAILYFGIDDHSLGGEREHASDVRWCPRCGAEYEYAPLYFGHIGVWSCPGCGAARPDPSIRVTDVRQYGFEATDLTFETPAGSFEATLRLGGLYNVYNAAAAVAVGVALDLPISALKSGLERTAAAFGRQERFDIDGKTVRVLLGKNPAGFNQLLHTLAAVPGPKHLALFLNDGIADGRDVSWIWDVDFERLRGQVASAVVGGRRATDMALRLRNGGVLDEPIIEEDSSRAIETALAATAEGGELYVLPTYTAMLKVREDLARRAGVGAYWEAQA